MKDKLRELLQTKLNTLSHGFPTCWQGSQEPEKAPVWGRYSINLGDTNPNTVGAFTSRTLGILTLQVMLRETEGTRPAYQAADTLSAGLRMHAANFNATDGVGHYRFAEISGPLQTGTSGGFNTFAISAPFVVDFSPTT